MTQQSGPPLRLLPGGSRQCSAGARSSASTAPCTGQPVPCARAAAAAALPRQVQQEQQQQDTAAPHRLMAHQQQHQQPTATVPTCSAHAVQSSARRPTVSKRPCALLVAAQARRSRSCHASPATCRTMMTTSCRSLMTWRTLMQHCSRQRRRQSAKRLSRALGLLSSVFRHTKTSRTPSQALQVLSYRMRARWCWWAPICQLGRSAGSRCAVAWAPSRTRAEPSALAVQDRRLLGLYW